MKKILFVIYSLGFGGAERSLVNLFHELPKDCYQIDLLLFHDKAGFMEQLPEWIHVLQTPRPLKQLYTYKFSRGKYCFVKIFGTICSKLFEQNKKAQKAFRWKHIYSRIIETLPEHYDTAVAYVGSEVMYFVHDKVHAEKKMVWIHNDYRAAGYSSKYDRSYFAEMDVIVSVSKSCVDTLKEEFPEYKEKTHCIENITSSSLIHSMADAFIPEEYNEGKYNLLSIGRLWPQKGFDIAIEAAALLKKKGLEFSWFVIGTGSLEEKLRAQIEVNHLQDCFILLGTRSNPYPYIKRASLLVQSSRWEGKSVVLDEAKIIGIPIVATAYPTVTDQISDHNEGIIVGLSPEEVADGIMHMLHDPLLDKSVREYLLKHEYGNCHEVEKYKKLLDA